MATPPSNSDLLNQLLNPQQSRSKPKGVRQATAVGQSYNVELQRMVREIKRDIDRIIMPVVKSSADQYTSDSAPVVTVDTWVDLLVQTIQQVRNRWASSQFAAIARRIAERFVRDAATVNAERNIRDMGIDIFTGQQQIRDAVALAIHNNVALIQSIPTQYLNQVESTILTNIRAGRRPSAIVAQLRDQYGITERRAKMIARDQTAKVNGDLNRHRQVAAGFPYFEWDDSDDERVRPRHHEIATKVTAYGRGIYRWDNPPLSDKGEPIIPGQDYQCFPGTSPVNIFDGVNKVFRHWYTGELTKFVTNTGETFESTPNHPVLTDRGWVAASALNLGDNVFRVSKKGFNVPKRNSDSSDIVFSELFEAAKLLGMIDESALVLGGEFHGDAIVDEQINIIRFDSELGVNLEPSEYEQCMKFLLTLSEQVVVTDIMTMPRHLDTVFKAVTGSPAGLVSSMCELLSFLSCGFTHADEHRFATVGLLYSSLIKDPGYNVSRGVKLFSDCFDTHTTIEQRFNLFKWNILAIGRGAFKSWNGQTPGADCFTDVVGVTPETLPSGFKGVSLTYERVTIVDKSIGEFTGHVYNLEMDNGLYISHDLAVSNCRCIARAVTQEEVDRNVKEGRTRPGVYR